ncbi:MAG: hypothetical protein RLZZ584_3292 [Pseudomonadota bacterium]|jgi:hypothetical protein
MKSKTLTTWLGLVGGSVGLDRIYLSGGVRDLAIWLHAGCTAAGAAGVRRVQTLGMDDTLAWVLIPIGGLSIALAMIGAIRHGLTADEVWNERHNPGVAEPAASGWANVIGVILSLLIGAVVLMSSITVAVQHYFEA